MTHELKIHPKHYKDVLLGLKKIEIRLNDRNYQENDTLLLNEYNPTTRKYSGSQVTRKVDYIIRDVPGLNPNYVIMQLSKPL